MAFVGGSAVPLGHVNSVTYTLDVIAVPAVFADPEQSWGSPKDEWLSSLASEVQGTRTLLYDHLLPEERSIEVKPRSHPDHQASVEKNASTQEHLQSFGFEDWADRLIWAIKKQRNSPALRRRPLVFICHSTGGIVVKQALSSKPRDGGPDLGACCVWIAFLSTPHRGSSTLSDHIFAPTLHYNMGLKYESGERLRGQLVPSSHYLEDLNYRFCAGSALGVQISSYVETEETELEVLTEENEGENLTPMSLTVVDPQSAELASSSAPMEEDLYYMRANHITIAALANDPAIRKAFVEDMRSTVRSTNSLDRAAHHDLIEHVMNETQVDVHQFYSVESDQSSSPVTKIWSESASFRNFLETSPSQILHRRLDGTPNRSRRSSYEALNHHDLDSQTWPKAHNPSITLQPPPTQYGHDRAARRPISEYADPELLTRPRPKVDEHVHRGQAYPAPSPERDRFMWIHVPFSVTGWVDPVMKVVAKDKRNPELPKKLLMDQLWKAHHNRSRHSSHHSRFVRPHCKVLRPKQDAPQDELLSPSSAVNELQFALFLPYLHWDTFRSLKQRNEIIKLRGEQDHIRPVSNDVLNADSLEHKVIWQFYGSNMPVHCRRTLDGYGYPSLANTDARDMDQVMFKRTSRSQPSLERQSKRPGHYFSGRLLSMRSGRQKPAVRYKVDKDSAYVLMVDELWLWVLQDDSMVTFATPKEQEPSAPFDVNLQADLRTEVLKDVAGDFARRVDDCFDHAALMVFHATRALIEEAEDPALNVFKTFEEHISEIAELHTMAFKQFRDSHKIDDPRMLLGGSHNLDYSADLDNLLELRDVEDELSTIKKLFVEQRKIVADMARQYEEEVNPRGKGLHGTVLLKEVESFLQTYEEQIESMVRSSQIAQSAFENLLDLKQKHSNIVEAHMTRFQTEMASEQAKSVMIFTIITIVFLPLSFFSSVFGMNVYEWSGESTNPSISYVLSLMTGASLAVIAVALAAAFNLPLRRALHRVWVRLLWRRIAEPTWRIMARAPFKRLRRIATQKQPDLEAGLTRRPRGPAPPPYQQRPGSEAGRRASMAQQAAAAQAAAARAPTDESEMDELWKQHAE